MYLFVPIMHPFLEVFLFMYLILFTFDKKKPLQYWHLFVPICHLLDKNLAIEKSYTLYSKYCQAKRMQKLCFPSSIRIEFGFE